MDIVTVQDYRDLTDDTTTSDESVSARIEYVVGLVQDELLRFLPLDTYTERLPVHNGVVRPSGVPVASVTTPDGAEVLVGGYGIGHVSNVAWWDPVYGPYEVWYLDPYTEVTYVGGYSRAAFPIGLRGIICDLVLTMRSRNPALTAAAVESARVGDVSVSYASGGTGTGAVDGLLPGTSRRLTRYRNPVA